MAIPSRWSSLQDGPSKWSRLQSTSPRTLAQPSGAPSQVRRQAENYNIANRLLRRQARRGDSRSALGLIALQDQANADGFSPGGIRRKDEFDAGILGRLQSMEKGAADRERAAGLNRQTADMAAGDPDAVEPVTPGATVSPETRTTAALDILEGEQRGDDMVTQRGLDSATRLGVTDPTGILRGDRRLTYNKTLDSALGAAKTPAEIAALRSRGAAMGVTPSAFDRRAEWWNRKRRTL